MYQHVYICIYTDLKYSFLKNRLKNTLISHVSLKRSVEFENKDILKLRTNFKDKVSSLALPL